MKAIRQYLGSSYMERAITVTRVSFFTNAAIGMGKLVLGIVLFSVWFAANGLYYLLLCLARGHLMKKYKQATAVSDENARFALESSVFRRSGIFLGLLGISYFLICARMYLHGDSTVYRGYLVYIVALVSFVKIGLAIHGTVVTRRLKSPILFALKLISFADAMVSIVVTQCTLLTFTESEKPMESSALFGMAISLAFVLAGVGMILIRPKKRQNKEKAR